MEGMEELGGDWKEVSKASGVWRQGAAWAVSPWPLLAQSVCSLP